MKIAVSYMAKTWTLEQKNNYDFFVELGIVTTNVIKIWRLGSILNLVGTCYSARIYIFSCLQKDFGEARYWYTYIRDYGTVAGF